MKNLVLTGTIKPQTEVFLNNVKERLNQYESTIKRYIKESEFDNIIFAENSEGDLFEFKKFSDMANMEKKKFEFIRVKSDSAFIKTRGKSFGEAILIQEAVKQSFLLKDELDFLKVTGRVYLNNSKILCKCNGNRFVINCSNKVCFTHCFGINIDDFKKFFNNIECMCDDSINMSIEKVFYRILLENKENMKIRSFLVYPDLQGVCGTSGTVYNLSVVNRIKRTLGQCKEHFEFSRI